VFVLSCIAAHLVAHQQQRLVEVCDDLREDGLGERRLAIPPEKVLKVSQKGQSPVMKGAVKPSEGVKGCKVTGRRSVKAYVIPSCSLFSVEGFAELKYGSRTYISGMSKAKHPQINPRILTCTSMKTMTSVDLASSAKGSMLCSCDDAVSVAYCWSTEDNDFRPTPCMCVWGGGGVVREVEEEVEAAGREGEKGKKVEKERQKDRGIEESA
jgi:hypothetical protein